jgi:glycosyltransferase involved in cell wall biosynthesis
MICKNLLVISDTKGQYRNGNWYIFNAVAKELDFISELFESITIILSDYSNDDVDRSLILLDSKVKVIALPKIGGNTLVSKIKTVMILPLYGFQIIKNIFLNESVHLRGPNTVTLLTMFILPFFQFKNVWFKYATNWNNAMSSANYKFQKWILTNVLVKSNVTINGFWANLPPHVFPFENPCLTELQVFDGEQTIKSKQFDTPFDLVFIGRIDSAKGVDILIDFIGKINNNAIGFFHVIGEGVLKSEFKKVLNAQGISNKFYGNLSQVELFDILKKSHCILLPSKSEGFPKVLAEAMNFGCIPIASNVGSISHYIQNGFSGIIMKDISERGLNEAWLHFLNLKSEIKLGMTQNGFEVSQKFTFEKYLHNLKTKIFNGC